MPGRKQPVRQALCCECGQVREFKVARNHREENYWLKRPIEADWHRETGDLKCEACARVTCHALLHPDGGWAADHAEKIRLIATGWSVAGAGKDAASRARIQQRWRQGLPQNPHARHLWWASDEEKARSAGETHFLAICKAEVPVPKRTRGTSYSRDQLIAPGQFHDVDREDPETGLWWFDLDCTHCLYRSNAIAVEAQRKALRDKLIEIVAKVDTIDAQTVAELLRHFGHREDCGR